jgi:hypothetical protein
MPLRESLAGAESVAVLVNASAFLATESVAVEIVSDAVLRADLVPMTLSDSVLESVTVLYSVLYWAAVSDRELLSVVARNCDRNGTTASEVTIVSEMALVRVPEFDTVSERPVVSVAVLVNTRAPLATVSLAAETVSEIFLVNVVTSAEFLTNEVSAIHVCPVALFRFRITGSAA